MDVLTGRDWRVNMRVGESNRVVPQLDADDWLVRGLIGHTV